MILRELKEHLPYTVFSVSAGLVMLGLLTFMAELHGTTTGEAFHNLYHIFHPLHLLFSATATTAMLLKYNKGALKAILVGIAGSVGICGISDAVLPWITSMLLGVKVPHLHICVIEHPMQILSFLVVGLLLGFISATVFSHSAHVLISSVASILYLVSYGLVDWTQQIGLVFAYMILAVIIPCCTSDIVLPVWASGRKEG